MKETIETIDNIEPYERKQPFCVISKDVFGEYSVRDIQTNSSWETNPYNEGYAVVPDDMVKDIVATQGFCDIELNSDGTEIVSFTAREVPEIPKPEKKPTTEERLVALEMAMLEQIGVVTE